MTDVITQRAETFIQLLETGLSYAQVAKATDAVSSDAVRNAVRRYNLKTHGTYTGFTSTGVPTSLTDSPPTDAKILVFDIECMYNLASVWSLKTRYIAPDNIEKHQRMVCWAGKFLGGPSMFASEWDHGRGNMLQALHSALSEADIVVGYNSDNYDIPFANTEFFLEGLGAPTPFKSVDLIKTLRSKFRMASYKLDFIADRFMSQRKMEHSGLQLWKDVEAGKPEARNTMKLYNIADVDLTARLYMEIRSWIKNHPPVMFDAQDIQCRACGSTEADNVGWSMALMCRYPLYKCSKCGFHFRTAKGRERITAAFGV